MRPAVVVSDSFSRAWRIGQTDVALGMAGLAPLDAWHGRPDAYGRELRATSIAVADSAAAAADLARRRTRQPAVLVRGLERFVSANDGPGAAALRRPPEEDLPLRAPQPPIGALGFEPQKICVPTIPTRWTITVFSTIDFAVAVPTPPARRPRCSRSSSPPARSPWPSPCP